MDGSIKTDYFEECKTDHANIEEGKQWKNARCNDTEKEPRVKVLYVLLPPLQNT